MNKEAIIIKTKQIISKKQIEIEKKQNYNLGCPTRMSTTDIFDCMYQLYLFFETLEQDYKIKINIREKDIENLLKQSDEFREEIGNTATKCLKLKKKIKEFEILTTDLVCENQGLKMKIDRMNGISEFCYKCNKPKKTQGNSTIELNGLCSCS